jgi:hypothetical protein
MATFSLREARVSTTMGGLGRFWHDSEKTTKNEKNLFKNQCVEEQMGLYFFTDFRYDSKWLKISLTP